MDGGLPAWPAAMAEWIVVTSGCRGNRASGASARMGRASSVTCAPKPPTLQRAASSTTGTGRRTESGGEGPFLVINKRGAHPRRHIQSLTPAHLKQFLDGFSTQDVALLTMAPEPASWHDALNWLVEQGIMVDKRASPVLAGPAGGSGELGEAAFQQAVQLFVQGFVVFPQGFVVFPLPGLQLVQAVFHVVP